MHVCRSQRRLQAQRCDELLGCVGRLTLLRQDGAQIIAQVGTLRSEFHSPPQLRCGLNLRVSLVEDAAKSSMSLRVRRSCFHGLACLTLCFRKISLLPQDAGQVQARCDEVRLDAKYSSELIQCAVQLSLPP